MGNAAIGGDRRSTSLVTPAIVTICRGIGPAHATGLGLGLAIVVRGASGDGVCLRGST